MRIFRWCEIVGWVRPSGTVRSQTQASPPSWAATMDTRRSRVGSASAFMTRDRSSAWAAVSGSRSSGAQQRAARARPGADGLEAAAPARGAAADDLLTWLVCPADIDACLYLVVRFLRPAAPEAQAAARAAAVIGLVRGHQGAGDPPHPRAAPPLGVVGRGYPHPDSPGHHVRPQAAGVCRDRGLLWDTSLRPERVNPVAAQHRTGNSRWQATYRTGWSGSTGPRPTLTWPSS